MSEVLQDATEALPDAAAMLADPAAAALALELLPVEQAARLLAATPVATTRQVWQRLSPATVQPP